MDLRFCMPERRGRGGRGQCCCGVGLAHIEVLHGGWGKVLACVLPSGAVHIFAEIVVKPKENAVLEIAQIEVPG